MYFLHIANKNYSSWSLRPWVLMKVLGIDFKEILHPFGQEGDWQNYRQTNPSGLVPSLIDGERLVWDSLAIIEYLAEKHPGVWPNTIDARAWARGAAAEMHSGFSALRQECSMTCGVRVKLHSPSQALAKDIRRIDDLWQEGINRFQGPFLAGDQFCAVDAFFAPLAFRFQTYGANLSETASNYVENLLQLPAMKLWYEDALNEPYRDEPHDAEVAEMGSVVADFRREVS